MGKKKKSRQAARKKAFRRRGPRPKRPARKPQPFFAALWQKLRQWPRQHREKREARMTFLQAEQFNADELLRQDYTERIKGYGLIMNPYSSAGPVEFRRRRQESGIRFRYPDLLFAPLDVLLTALLVCALLTVLSAGGLYLLYREEMLTGAFFLSALLCLLPYKTRAWIALSVPVAFLVTQLAAGIGEGAYTLQQAGEAFRTMLSVEAVLMMWSLLRFCYASWRTMDMSVCGYITANAYLRSQPINQPDFSLDAAWTRYRVYLYLFLGSLAVTVLWLITMAVRLRSNGDVADGEFLFLFPLALAALHFSLRLRYTRRYYKWHNGEDRSLF